MLRVAFLFLVVLGALALFLGLAVGLGVWQAARLQQPAAEPAPAAPAPAAPAPSATRPAAGAVPAGGTRPASGAAQPPTPGAKADRPNRTDGDAKPPQPNLGDADWPPPDPAGGGRRKRPAGERDDFVLPLLPLARPVSPVPPRVLPVDPAVQPVVLDARSADVRGTGGLRAGGDAARKALVDWRGEPDAAVWSVDVPTTGIYVVEAEYACDADAGGSPFWVRFAPRDLPGPKPRVTGVVAPTGGWDDYRTAPVGQTYLPAGKTDVLMRPVALKPGRRLPNLRAIRLTLVADEREKDRGATGVRGADGLRVEEAQV